MGISEIHASALNWLANSSPKSDFYAAISKAFQVTEVWLTISPTWSHWISMDGILEGLGIAEREDLQTILRFIIYASSPITLQEWPRP